MKTNLRSNAKSLLNKMAPTLLQVIQTVNNRRLFRERFEKFQQDVKDVLYDRSNIIVLSGPFMGLKYIDAVVWGSITPKWLGSYEYELTQIVEEIVANDYDTIIDVGCAEGYYAVGLAYRSPRTQIYAFDIDFISRRQLLNLAHINGLQNKITLGKYCSFDDIRNKSRGKTLLISDIEGYERELLNPDICESLKRIDVLVELHESDDNFSVKNLIYNRFKQTHNIQEINSTNREGWIKNFRNNRPDVKLTHELFKKASNEGRPNGQTWFWMQA